MPAGEGHIPLRRSARCGRTRLAKHRREAVSTPDRDGVLIGLCAGVGSDPVRR